MNNHPYEQPSDTESATAVREQKPVCYRCRKGIARHDTARMVSVWSVANRPERVTVCGACWIAPTPRPTPPPA